MPTFTVPNSYGTLTEFNPCHNPKGPAGGQFCSTKGRTRGQQRLPGMESRSAKKVPVERTLENAKQPIKTKDLSEAVDLILKGQVVELPDVKTANTVLSKLGAMALDAKSKGQKAPYYDLCKVTVPGTNLFCGQSLKTKEFPDGVPRIKMPQLGGKPIPGSEAAKLMTNERGEVDGSEQFIAYLRAKGIRVSTGQEAAARLKASQSELRGPVVAGMMADPTYDPAKGRIFISKDRYVIDGHHRWAAVVGRDAEEGHLGDLKMNVVRVNVPMSAILHLANQWAAEFGIKSEAAQ